MSFFRYVFGPKLYMEYGMSNVQKLYEPIGLEKFGDQIISTVGKAINDNKLTSLNKFPTLQLSLMWTISFYTSPLLVTFLYRRGYFVMESISTVTKISTSIGLIVMVSMIMRGMGRSQSPSYTRMVKAMELLKSPNTEEEGKRALRLFDFEFDYWKVDFDVKNIQSDEKKGKGVVLKKVSRLFRWTTFPCEIIAYFAIQTFGIRMMYPGSVKLLQSYMRSMLVTGRGKLIEEENARRFKVRTLDANDIDTIFVDNRYRNVNGKILVICSEGNAGFYEIGIMATPLSLKYSVLGWNHPGFEGSTGKPFPDQDKNAVEAVVKFAIYHLGFSVNDILLYGWSIGGYSSLWAATCYPDVKGVVLDATFDDVLYLAQSRMPQSLSGIVRIAIRDYCNLHNTELAQKYNGPINLIRRTEDEIIAEDNNIETNRGNFLALSILKYRYPYIFTTPQINRCKKQLSKPLENRNFTTPEDDLCMSRLVTYVSDQGKKFPLAIGEDYNEEVRNEMAEFLLRKHLRDFKSTHCTPLPAEFFNLPWDIPVEQDFVFT
uniref:AB hydrolase-1 domain-containing protein n=1 Tax=Glossina austeni TaxID=7395 RepID=A0A1A9UTS3_GLOAU